MKSEWEASKLLVIPVETPTGHKKPEEKRLRYEEGNKDNRKASTEGREGKGEATSDERQEAREEDRSLRREGRKEGKERQRKEKAQPRTFTEVM